MKIKLKRMWQLAVVEAKNLKKAATKQEKKRLVVENFDPTNSKCCIYGLMTGNCFSLRAASLIEECAERVYKLERIASEDFTLNGVPEDMSERRLKYYSPIEVLIFDSNGGREAGETLLRFIKGETKRITIPS